MTTVKCIVVHVRTVYIYVLRRVGMGTIPELSLRKVGIPTLSGEVRIPTWHGSIPEMSLRKVGIGTKLEIIIFLRKVGIGDKVRIYVSLLILLL